MPHCVQQNFTSKSSLFLTILYNKNQPAKQHCAVNQHFLKKVINLELLITSSTTLDTPLAAKQLISTSDISLQYTRIFNLLMWLFSLNKLCSLAISYVIKAMMSSSCTYRSIGSQSWYMEYQNQLGMLLTSFSTFFCH